ncbi:hypothetical protein yc1106_06912 [Curvularia clavata]|uniref:Uncharacterized protein n=1 Tax=Curvularia clavata TaxID=95742 RepID=A0A9Q8ZG95_CURCL|nr:hypothetical protein yc1106_06912 [Curvularia clavata]
MLDENLPTFFLKPSTEKIKHQESFYFTQHGSDAEAQYALHHLDPTAPNAKNTYAVALFDSRNPDILYGEVMSKPGWTHPTLSQEEIRKNGGVPPPPQPIYPTEFAIQLYNPDMRVVVSQTTAKWSSTVSWEFSLPQVAFRTPSNSDLDRTLTDPGADINTPRINFAWRKEGRLGKDMTCYMVGKSTDPTGKKAKKSKEGDIAVAMFSGLKELTIMEPNLYRVELEDYKGLEVTLLLGAAVIRDLFFSDLNEQFHISSAGARKNSGGLRARKGSSPLEAPNVTKPVMTPEPPPPPAYTPSSSQYLPEKAPLPDARGPHISSQPPPPSYTNNNNAAKRASLPPLTTGASGPSQRPQPQRPVQSLRPTQPAQPLRHSQQRQPGPRLDPRSQWEIEAETARLKAQVEAEEREQKRQAEAQRKARRKQEEEQERKTLQFLEQERKQKEREEKERQRRRAEVDKETERLKKQFGDQSNLFRPSPRPQHHSAPSVPSAAHNQRPHPAASRPVPGPVQPPRPQPPRVQVQGPYLQPPAQHRPAASQSSFFSNGLPKPVAKAKKSFWGLRTQSESNAEKLKKKKSSMF